MNYIQKVKKILSSKINVEPELLDLYTLIVFLKGTGVTLENVHDAWSIWRTNITPKHKSIVPFLKLSTEIQELDREYAEAIKEASKAVAL